MRKIIDLILAGLGIVTVFAVQGCSSVPRTKFTDKTMRVMVDPEGVDAANYVRIEQALVGSEKWTVVDRGQGFSAIKKEQERSQRDEADRFSDREKWAHWSKLYGVGGVVSAHVQCQQKRGFFGGLYLHCTQSLAIMDSNTGEVIAAVSKDANSDRNEYELAPSWEDTVVALNDAYPAKFHESKDTRILEDYRQVSKEEAQRRREAVPTKEEK